MEGVALEKRITCADCKNGPMVSRPLSGGHAAAGERLASVFGPREERSDIVSHAPSRGEAPQFLNAVPHVRTFQKLIHSNSGHAKTDGVAWITG